MEIEFGNMGIYWDMLDENVGIKFAHILLCTRGLDGISFHLMIYISIQITSPNIVHIYYVYFISYPNVFNIKQNKRKLNETIFISLLF